MSAKTPAEKNTPATVEDVVAKAAEEKLVTVPQQETRTPEEVAADAVDEIFENGKDNKKSLKDRVADAKAKLSEHRKLVVAVGIAVVVASVSAYKQAAKKKAESEMLEEEIVPVETEPFVDETLESDSEPAV